MRRAPVEQPGASRVGSHVEGTRLRIGIVGRSLAGVVAIALLSPTACDRAAPATPTAGALFGAFVQPGPTTGADRRSAVTALEDSIGRPLAMERVYYRWDEPWPTADDVWTRDAGRIPFISWNTTSANGAQVRWAEIAAGVDDPILHARAADLIAFGSPVVFSFSHEPDNDGAAGTASDYIAAYRHVHDLFQAAGVTNVTYAWTMTASSFGTGGAAAFYPGDDVVDVIAADGYNWYGCPQGGSWRSFAQVFAPFYAFGQQHGKRMIVAEWGVREDPAVPGRKASWIDDASAQLQRWPGIVAVLYFDADRGCPRWVDSSSSSLAAFRAMGAEPYFNPPTTIAIP